LKLTLVVPGWPRTSMWHHFKFPFPPLSLATLAAITPSDWEIRIEDENVGPLDLERVPDVVGFTAMTPLAPRAYELAAHYRAKGALVVMGGFHASLLPEEAARHVDAVVVGEAERVWPQVLADAREGRLQSVYRSQDRPDLAALPAARRDLFEGRGYIFLNTMQTTRGCPFDCDFCSVTAFYGHTLRSRPIACVERELLTLHGGGGFLFLVDDNVFGDTAYARELFTMLKRHSFKWMSQSSILLAEHEEMLRLAADSGCIGLFVGFESLLPEALVRLNKKFGHPERYAEAMRKFHDHGIGIQGSFVFGYDWDDAGSFDRVQEFCDRTRLDSAFFTLLTPFPGTRVYDRMVAEGRLTTRDWSRYDMSHVVFKPAKMTEEQLLERFQELYRSFYSVRSLLWRLPFARRAQVFLPMNWGFHRAWKRAFAVA
jgi:radical SAM superfamily enzyme YgiQ (UPF0313 family)